MDTDKISLSVVLLAAILAVLLIAILTDATL